ncbi:MAG: tRNA dihydrouridine synthase DusB [Spirochaetaceae bacterium]|nr:tRNA dihydrouridine synthase DusB [Spirochaetaceae bacterium]GMO27397.1 MAG: tRNA dihydrouridine synthase DusB [Termitinemataceae bacterium]
MNGQKNGFLANFSGKPVFLAPLAGWTESVFRSLCIEAGADFCWTELVSSEALVRGADCRLLLRRAHNETAYAIQLFGSNPNVMAEAARRVLCYSPSLIDINAGCPVPKVTKSGAGAALMKSPALLGKIVEAVAKAVSPVPVSVKIRSGWDAASINFEECAESAVAHGAALVSIHPRTRAQGYGGKSDWLCIKKLARSLPVPVCGSGDLFFPEDVKRMFDETGCAAVMIARGAQGNPFIFSQSRAFIESKTYTEYGHEQRLAMALRHLELLAASAGEKKACVEMRKIFCAYLKGISGASELRAKIVHCSSIADYKTACALCR